MTLNDPRITVIGLGPGDPGLLTQQTLSAMQQGQVYLRTRMHAALDAIPESANWPSFDDLFERPGSFDAIYTGIVDSLITASGDGPIVYAVPGHPLFGESTVRLLLERATQDDVTVRVLPAISFLDSVTATLGLDPVEHNLQIVDALELVSVVERQPFAGGLMPVSPLRPAIVAQIYSPGIASAVKRALMQVYPMHHEIALVTAGGSGEDLIQRAPLADIDRRPIDQLSNLYIPAIDPLDAPKVAEGLQRIIARLRAPGGCPWDREQTHETLTRHMLEEAHEVIHAIEEGSTGDLAEELGDVLLQVYLHAQIAEEAGEFSLEDVFQAVSSKLVRRHPHVFGDRTIDTAGEVVKAWDQIKRQERAGTDATEPESPFASIPRTLPALARAQSMLKRASSRGLTTTPTAVDSTGDIAVDNVARQLVLTVAAAAEKGIDAEQALRQWTTQFERQVRELNATSER